MYGNTNKPDTLQTAQMLCEEKNSPLDSDCMTRMMTPEEWEKYGPLIKNEHKKKQKSKLFREF